MKKSINLLIAAALTLAAASCGGKDKAAETTEAAQQDSTTVCADICGKWYLDNIVLSDTVSVRPAEEDAEAAQYVVFEDSTYSFVTNCNTIAGPYTLKGDSITFGAGPMTQMACENMKTEDAIRQLLPELVTVTVENDSTARLSTGNASQYIMLRKAAENK